MIIEIAVVVIVWLGLGGWSLRELGPGTPEDLIFGFAVACLLFAPFAGGVAVSERLSARRAAIKTAKETTK